MDLWMYLSLPTAKPISPDCRGEESEWLDWCEVNLRGPQFLIVDAGFVPSKENGLLVGTEPGIYRLAAKVITYGTDRRISRVRAVLDGAEPVRAEPYGETWTDTARTGICDYQRFSEAWGEDDEASYDRISGAFETEELFGEAVLDPVSPAVMPFVSSGFGDGTFPVFLLKNGPRTVGFEIEFIESHAPYPFGSATEDGESRRELHAMLPNAIAALAKGGSEGKERQPELADAIQSARAQANAELEIAFAEWRDHLKAIRTGGTKSTLRLEPSTETDWLDALPEAATSLATLRGGGFEWAGVFGIQGRPGVQIAGLVHVDRAVHASLIKAGNQVFVGFTRRGTNGLVNEATNLPPSPEPCPEYLRRFHEPRADLTELLRKLDGRSNVGSWLPATPGNFAALCESDHARHTAWLAERGGKTTAELRAGFQAAGKLPEGEEGEEFLAMARNDEVERSLWNWLRLQPALPFDFDTAADRLVAIYDGETPALLLNAYLAATGDTTVKEREFGGGPARRAFERIVEARQRKLRLVLRKETGLAADFWLPD